MIKKPFSGRALLIAAVPLFANPPICSEHQVTTHAIKHELPGSKELHDKIGRQGFVEKQYATLKFTKKSSEEVDLARVIMQWHGPHVSHLSGTLFKQTTDELLPLHENLVATGRWNEEKQQLIFSFGKPIALRGTTIFSVVLTVNPELEAILDSEEGSFSLDPFSLPEAFQTAKK